MPQLARVRFARQLARGTIANIKEAIEGYIDVLREDNLPVLEERFEALLVAV